MKIAHILDGRILGFYPKDQPPRSYKGRMLPVVESERPGVPQAGQTWSVKAVVFEDRVELMWVQVPLSGEEQEALGNVAETDRLRDVMEELRAGQGTAAERLARLERVVGHLCKLTFQA